MSATSASPFSLLSDDILLTILSNLDADPRDWARLSCVSPRLSLLIRSVCLRSRCSRLLPSDLLLTPSPPSWPSLHKLSVCCPGLRLAGVLLEHSDFGLHRDIGPHTFSPSPSTPNPNPNSQIPPQDPDLSWSLFDDLYSDAVYHPSGSADLENPNLVVVGTSVCLEPKKQPTTTKKAKKTGAVGAHLAAGPWTLSREQGNKLLASRFRGDCLYICDWPGCVHAEEKRKYMLFRGVFKNFKRSRVWKTIIDLNRGKIPLDCAFCDCKETWDLHSAFCLRRVFGFHDDGEPVVRAYVCENGHVSGAWTERPMYA